MGASNGVDEKFLKPYNPAETEDRIYRTWEESGFFNPDICIEKGVTEKDAEPFSIVLPPPNVTGTLHIGHAAMLAIEDILVRFNRMRGKRALWIPGTDHASIATQAKVENDIYKKEKKHRNDFTREELVKRIEQFAKESHDTIVKQLRKMGSSLDWSREAFTLDEKRSHAVRTAFKRMYDAGLVYRGYRAVNWDPKGQTTISDDEIVYVEERGTFYYLKYGPFVIGTARPETKFGDKYVVMHPADTRYAKYRDGQKLEIEWINGKITTTVIKDEAVDMNFGTGVMTITPWHSMADFEIAKRHKLDTEQIIDEHGRLLPVAQEFAQMKIAEARPKIVEKLREKGLLVKEEEYVHKVATAERTGGIIEPQIKLQWFVDVNKRFQFPGTWNYATGAYLPTLREWMHDALASKAIKIIPEYFDKTYFHWIENLHDWCISRQIWYGHRIPVWYRSTNAHGKSDGTTSDSRGVETYCGVESPEGDGWEQDPDTLDTWFSSGLWTFSTLGWPEESPDLHAYHPTNLLETGYDILFFWVARMILMSGFLLGDIPFHTVYLHGLVRDAKGRKMSKSLGNIIDPLHMIEKYGADATRLSLVIGATPGADMRLSEERVRGYKHFANKLWNMTRFVLEHGAADADVANRELTDIDQKFLAEFETLTKDVTADIENYRLYLAAEKLYHYAWHQFADVIIEESKPILKTGDEKAKRSRKDLLIHIFANLIKLLHPFTPFVTEEIWQSMPPPPGKNTRGLLMVSPWPKV